MIKRRPHQYFLDGGRLYRMTPARFERLVAALAAGAKINLSDPLWGAFEVADYPLLLGIYVTKARVQRNIRDMPPEVKAEIAETLERLKREHAESEERHKQAVADIEARRAADLADLEARLGPTRRRA